MLLFFHCALLHKILFFRKRRRCGPPDVYGRARPVAFCDILVEVREKESGWINWVFEAHVLNIRQLYAARDAFTNGMQRSYYQF